MSDFIMEQIVINGCPIAMGKTNIIVKIATDLQEHGCYENIIQCDDPLIIAKMNDDSGDNDEYNYDYYFGDIIFGGSSSSQRDPIRDIIKTQSNLGGRYMEFISGKARKLSVPGRRAAFVFSREPWMGAVYFSCLNTGTLDHLKEFAESLDTQKTPLSTCKGKILPRMYIDYEGILFHHVFDGSVRKLMDWCYHNMEKRNRNHERSLYPNFDKFFEFFTFGGDENTYTQFKDYEFSQMQKCYGAQRMVTAQSLPPTQDIIWPAPQKCKYDWENILHVVAMISSIVVDLTKK